jgi:hypothetical protein
VNHTEELGKMRVNITSFSESLDSIFKPAPRHGQPGPGACQWAGIGQCRTTSLEQGQLNQRTRIFTIYQPGMRAVTLAGLIKGAYQTPLLIIAGCACLYRSVVGRQYRPTGLYWTGNTGQLVCIGQATQANWSVLPSPTILVCIGQAIRTRALTPYGRRHLRWCALEQHV